jgi:peptidyl-prolyl cis-trans isomerase A (cyclophilin A)
MKKINITVLILLTIVLAALYIVFLRSATPSNKSLPQVKIQTELGAIILEIEVERATPTAENFLRYVDEDRFDTASFYRVVRMDNQPNDSIFIEVIQGGIGYEKSSLRLPAIFHETTLQTGILHKNGVISMARSKPGTASSEFFICIGDQPCLDYGGKRNPDGQGFAAFGRVIQGMEVVLDIQNQSDEGQMLLEPINIIDVSRIELK